MHEQTREILKLLMKEHEIASERQLAISCSMSQSTLHRFLKGDTDSLDYPHLRSLADFFSLTVSQLTGETPFNPDNKIRVVTLAMEAMPEYKKDVIVAASHSLSESNDSGKKGSNGKTQ